MLDQYTNTQDYPTTADAFWAYSQNVEDTIIEYFGEDRDAYTMAREIYEGLVRHVFNPEIDN